jgi:uncharacterized BrkB/YihY/UPF0761 family membrane protein
MESFTIKRLRTKAIFKIVFIGLACSFIPFFTFMGLLASQDLVSMYWGQTPINGFKAVVLGPFFGIFFTIVFGLFISVFTSLGLMLYAKRRSLTLEYHEVLTDENN